MKKVKDGTEVDVQYAVAMPEGTPVLRIGELVSAIDERGNHIVFNEPIALFHHGKYHCVAYV